MPFRLIPVLALLSVSRLLLAQAPAPTPTPSPPSGEATVTFPARVEQVLVDVVVTDKQKNPVTGLEAGDFRVEEDGVAQEITSFEAIELPAEPPSWEPQPPPRLATNVGEGKQTQASRTFVVIVDDLNLTPLRGPRAKAAVAAFLEEGVRPGDWVTLLTTGGGTRWSSQMPHGRDGLASVLERLEGRRHPDTSPDRMSDYEALQIHVYDDPEIMARVTRRFDSFGSNMGMRLQLEDEYDYTIGAGDPWVRTRATEIYREIRMRNRLTLGVIRRMLEALTTSQGRKALILVSDGFVQDPGLDEFKAVIQASRRSNAAIYFLNTRGLEGFGSTFGVEYGGLVDVRDVGSTLADDLEAAGGSVSLAVDSGGFAVQNTNDLGSGILRIAAESRAYYMLGYTPTNATRDGEYRRIEVETSRKGVRVRARRGYYAPLPDGSLGAGEPEATDPAMQQALDSPFEVDGVPIRMTAYVFEETLLGKASVTIAADVDVREFAFTEEEGRFHDSLELLLFVTHRETGELFSYNQEIAMRLRPGSLRKIRERWYPVLREFELAEGSHQAKIVARDKNGRDIGSLHHEFEVPDLGSLRTSTPILSDVILGGDLGSGSQPKLSVLARRTFERGSTLYCSYDVYGAARDLDSGMPRVKAGFQIRRVDGGVHTAVAPTEILATSLGALERMMGIRLEGTSPGEYELVLDIEDTIAGRRFEVREPFTVVESLGES